MELNELNNMVDIMIKASNKANITKEQLFDTFNYGGLMAVYNLGLRHMYEYLKSKEQQNNDSVSLSESVKCTLTDEDFEKAIDAWNIISEQYVKVNDDE